MRDDPLSMRVWTVIVGGVLVFLCAAIAVLLAAAFGLAGDAEAPSGWEYDVVRAALRSSA